MTTLPNPCCGFRFPAKVIEHAVWLYHPFSLSLREVALILDPPLSGCLSALQL